MEQTTWSVIIKYQFKKCSFSFGFEWYSQTKAEKVHKENSLNASFTRQVYDKVKANIIKL